MTLCDAHTHLDAPAFDADRAEVVARARAAGVRRMVVAGTTPETWDQTERIGAEVGADVVLGVHPWWADRLDAAALELLRTRPLVGLGELGLDWLKGPERPVQLAALREQLAVARERDLPVVLHCVRAYPELLRVLERDGMPARGGMVHAWSGPPEAVDRALALGLMVSFGPLVCRDRAKKARASVPRVPLDRLLVETDCPDGRLPGHERGEPADVVEVVRVVAELRGEGSEGVAAASAENLDRLLAPDID